METWAGVAVGEEEVAGEEEAIHKVKEASTVGEAAVHMETGAFAKEEVAVHMVKEVAITKEGVVIHMETEASTKGEVVDRMAKVAFVEEGAIHKGMEATTGEVAFAITAVVAIADTSLVAPNIATITITMIAIAAKIDTDQLVYHLI